MKLADILFTFASLLSCVSTAAVASRDGTTQCEPWKVDKKHRIFVLSDIANEPDDTMSFIRLLSHSDLFTIEGLVAITSFWLPNATYPNQIQTLVDAYAGVRNNLQSHSNNSYPTVEYLSSKIASGPKTYGSQALKELETGGNLTAGAQLLIEAVDASDEPLYVQMWGGENTVATALWYLNRTRSAADFSVFRSKIRAYSISDQDDTGIWIRQNWPDIRWVASRHGFNQYNNAAWTGISTLGLDCGGPNDTIVSQPWLTANIQVGPFGEHYPDIAFIMEGDTPSFLFSFPNGLGNPEYPSWGSWGGRYTPNPLNGYAQYGEAADNVTGVDGKYHKSDKATIWRWRDAFQHEFAARIQWTLAPNNGSSSTTHPPVVVVNGSCGTSALEYNVTVGQNLTLDASGTYSPDAGANLNYTWFQYLEPSSYQDSAAVVPVINFTYPAGSDGRAVGLTIPAPQSSDGNCVAPQDVTQFGVYGEMSKCPVLHVVLAVKDLKAKNPITRYRRVLLNVQPYQAPSS